MKIILETTRLVIRELEKSDAEFILKLLNAPSFLKYIGDRNVRTKDQARIFIEEKYRKSYTENGFGLYAVDLKSDNATTGICGLVKREGLDMPDIGFAFLPEFEGKGFGFESASAILNYSKETLGISEVWAIATQDNSASHNLLEKLGFTFDRVVTMSGGGGELKLFSKVL